MPRIKIESLIRPRDRFVVLSLIPVRAGDLHQDERRPRITRERLLLESKAFFQLAESFHQAAVLDQRLGMVRIDLERPAQASLGGGPIPFAQKEDNAERRLCIGAL